MKEIKIFENGDKLALAATKFVISAAKKAIKKTGRFTIALSGGSTPDKMFTLLASQKFSEQVDWRNVFIFWGDERCVPASNPENNSHQAKKLLLSIVPVPAENIFAVPTRMQPANAALKYAKTIREFFRSDMPVFDLILLGMGDDGHTASLFPGTAVVHEQEAIIKEVFVPKVDMFRITFTAPLINHAKQILFLISGKKKANALQKVLQGRKNIDTYPAQTITGAENNKVFFYVDVEAAAKLKSSPQV